PRGCRLHSRGRNGFNRASQHLPPAGRIHGVRRHVDGNGQRMHFAQRDREEVVLQMKRGLITWDKSELAPAVFDERLGRVRALLSERQLPALVVYSELWRSNQGRFFSNYMPYFNRAFLVIPVDGTPTLFCGLSPRVYGWIRSVTIIE